MASENQAVENGIQTMFASSYGGGYAVIPAVTSANDVRSTLDQLKDTISDKDQYLQYSSSHGTAIGLAGINVTYDEIRDKIMALPAQEIVIFMSACYSGKLIDSFNQRRAEWSHWHESGRSLFIMTSAPSDKESFGAVSTVLANSFLGLLGPDSSVSYFEASIFNAFLGAADGAVDGKKDGIITLGEIKAYVESYHQLHNQSAPVVAGDYNPDTPMVRIPTKLLDDTRWQAAVGDGQQQAQKMDAAVRNLNQAMDQLANIQSTFYQEVDAAIPADIHKQLDDLSQQNGQAQIELEAAFTNIDATANMTLDQLLATPEGQAKTQEQWQVLIATNSYGSHTGLSDARHSVAVEKNIARKADITEKMQRVYQTLTTNATYMALKAKFNDGNQQVKSLQANINQMTKDQAPQRADIAKNLTAIYQQILSE